MNNLLEDEVHTANCNIQFQLLMRSVGFKSFKALSKSTGISIQTINKIRAGKMDMLSWQTIVKVSTVLKISPLAFIDRFGGAPMRFDRQELATLKQEYAQLQQQLQQQKITLLTEFQQQSLQVLESFLTYFPTAKHAALNNPDFPAAKLLPLVGSIDRLIAQWGVTTIGTVGAEISYDPQYHQLIEGSAVPDELVTVRYIGYQQGDKLLFRAKVSKDT